MKQQLPKRFTRSQLDNNNTNNHQVTNTKVVVVSKSNKRRQNSHRSNKVNKGSAPSSKLKGRVTRSQIANNQTLVESRQDDEDEEDNNKMSSIPSSSNNTASSATTNNSDTTKRANETSSSLKPLSSSNTTTQPSTLSKRKEETPEQIAFRKSYPLTNISEPTNNDCLFGRGGGTNHHPGNKHYRSIVDSQKSRYLNSKRLDKPMVAMEM